MLGPSPSWCHHLDMGTDVTVPDVTVPSPARSLTPHFHYRVVVLDKVTDLLLFFGKLLVVGGVGKGHSQGLQSQAPPGVQKGVSAEEQH